MAFKHGNHTLIDLDAGNDTKITSAAGQDIVFYPDQHIWIKQGTKLTLKAQYLMTLKQNYRLQPLQQIEILILPR